MKHVCITINMAQSGNLDKARRWGLLTEGKLLPVLILSCSTITVQGYCRATLRLELTSSPSSGCRLDPRSCCVSPYSNSPNPFDSFSLSTILPDPQTQRKSPSESNLVLPDLLLCAFVNRANQAGHRGSLACALWLAIHQ